MKIGILSDTHGIYKYLDLAMKYLQSCDYVIHCGDVLYGGYSDEDIMKITKTLKNIPNLTIAMGNCDSNRELSLIGKEFFHNPYAIVDLGKYIFFVTHGHHYSYLNLFYKAKELGCNVVCYGHTHIKDISSEEDIQIINPGSISKPRDGSHSIAIIDNDVLNIIDVENDIFLYSKEMFS